MDELRGLKPLNRARVGGHQAEEGQAHPEKNDIEHLD
jgi:hypothetical protein